MHKNSHSPLSNKKCSPCEGHIAPLKGQKLNELRTHLHKDWSVIQDHHLERTFVFSDFNQGLAFVNKVGAIAEQEGHHPDILLTWGKVKLMLCTHSIDGLSENDFILAAKCDGL